MGAGLVVSGLWGCQPVQDLPQVPLPPAPLPETHGPLLSELSFAPAPGPVCMDRTPVVVEVPVPVAMPCQLKEPAEFQATKSPRNGTRNTVASGNQAARVGPTDARWINAMQVYQYMAGALYQVHAAVWQVTSLLLQPGEQLVGKVAAGDTERWEIVSGVVGSAQGQRVVIFLKPHWANLKTNLTIPTDKRLYLIEVQSNQNGTYMAQVTWEYPQDAPILASGVVSSSPPQTGPVTSSEPVPNGQLCGVTPASDRFNFGYTMAAKRVPAWKPERVFDDGSKTYIQFPATLASTDAPALVGKTDNGNVQLVNYLPQYGCYIADRVLNTWELRFGEKQPLILTITRTLALGGE